MRARAKTVLMLTLPMGEILPRMRTGVLKVADANRWELHIVTCLRYGSGKVLFDRPPQRGTLAELVGLLQPDGMIVALDSSSQEELEEAVKTVGLSSKMPIVYLTEPANSSGKVYSHEQAHILAELALRELIRCGFENYSFAPDHLNRSWSKARGEAFAHLVSVAGKVFHPQNITNGKTFSSWLESLPKPCGIFAANDVEGETVLRHALELRIDVPGEISVVGVDDNASICDHTKPTLSSIRRDLEGEGRVAAELLLEWMSHPSNPPTPRFVPPVALVRRSSTRLSWQRDCRVAQAEEWIRLHACEEGISVRNVVREMRVSRTTADRLFRTVADHSILEEIQVVRIETAKQKLRAGAPIDIVAVECGFASTLDFRRVFKKITGQPVVRWAKQNC